MLQSILRLAVQRRWPTLFCTAVIAGIGIQSLRRLPIDAVPDITNNQVQINTLVPSLSPVEVEKQITFSIETALAGIPGLESTRSLSRNGFSQVTAIFEDSVDIYFARQQVGERLTEARDQLPPGAEPKMGPIATGLGEIYMYTVEFEHPHGKGAELRASGPGWRKDGSYSTPEGTILTSKLEQTAYLRTVQDWIIRPQLKGVRDVAGVDSIGGFVKQYHVQPDPMKLVSYGLTFADVVAALERNNVSTGAGYVEHKGETYVVRATGRLEALDQIESVVVGSRRGVPIHVRDVVADGGVAIGRELRTGSASENGEEIVVGTAIMLLGSNSRTVAAAVDAKMEEIGRSLPPDIRAKTVLNRTKLVEATVATVRDNLIEGAVLVVVVLLLLLGNVRAALITALAIPLSMLITATGMVTSKISGNLMSLGAIDFGLIVDGAVIIVENCLRRLVERQHGLGRELSLGERLHEVAGAAMEMVQPSVYGQAIIVTVYFPILTLTGVEGKMFHPMAMTVIFALVGAFVLSLTFVPAMVALVMRGRLRERDVLVIRATKAIYAPVVRWAIRMRLPVVSVAAVAFAGALVLFQELGQEFVPTLDEKDLALQAVRIPSTSLTQSTEMQFDVERTLSAFPEVSFVFSKTGTAELASDPMPPSASDTFVIFKPRQQWPDPKEPKSSLLERIEGAVMKLPGNNYEFTQPIQMRFNELIAGVRGDVAVKVYGDDMEQLTATAEAIGRELGQVRGAADVKVEQTEGLPVLTIDVDRVALGRYGLSVAEVQDVVAAAIGGRNVGLVFEQDRRFDLVVRLPDRLRGNMATLANLPIPLGLPTDPAPTTEPQGDTIGTEIDLPRQGFVPLGQLAKIVVTEGQNQISRENGKRRVVVQANVRGRDLGSFVEEAQARIRPLPLPAGSWLSWGGQFENLLAARARLSVVVPICFLLIFLLLFSTFGSARYALLVFSGVPLALTGGVVALWLRGMPFSISAGVGFIALSGVAVLNSLVMVSYINELRRQGMSAERAILDGAVTRLRPVLTTALVASLGFVPMAIASGTGAEVQKPLATVVIGGLISSTLLTLIVLPGLYRMFLGRVPAESASSE